MISKQKLSSLLLSTLFVSCLACTSTLHVSNHQKALVSRSKQSKSQSHLGSNLVKTRKNQVQSSNVNQVNLNQIQKTFKKWHLAPTRSVMVSATKAHQKKIEAHVLKATPSKLSIVVLLPLSGPEQSWGTLIQKSLGYLQSVYPQFNFHFADTQSDSVITIQNLDHLMTTLPKVDVVIGPLSPQVILNLSHRVQWYALPWFPLGSLPTLSTNHFNFSWRLEAQDEAKALAKTLCKSKSKTAGMLLVDQPKTRLLAKRLRRLLKSCRIELVKTVILPPKDLLNDTQQSMTKALIQLSGRSLNGQANPWWTKIHKSRSSNIIKQAPKVNYESLIILAKGKQLRRLLRALSLWDLDIKPSSIPQQNLIKKKYRGQTPPWLKVFTALGCGGIVSSLAKSVTLEGLICLERAPLSAQGKNYLQRRPHANSLELELVDLLTWLNQANSLSQTQNISLVKAIRMVTSIDGQWGKRYTESSKLHPVAIKYFRVQNRKLRLIY